MINGIFFSDSSLCYAWNQEKESNHLKDTQHENAVIDIREINRKNNGYIGLALTNDGKPDFIMVLF